MNFPYGCEWRHFIEFLCKIVMGNLVIFWLYRFSVLSHKAPPANQWWRDHGEWMAAFLCWLWAWLPLPSPLFSTMVWYNRLLSHRTYGGRKCRGFWNKSKAASQLCLHCSSEFQLVSLLRSYICLGANRECFLMAKIEKKAELCLFRYFFMYSISA